MCQSQNGESYEQASDMHKNVQSDYNIWVIARKNDVHGLVAMHCICIYGPLMLSACYCLFQGHTETAIQTFSVAAANVWNSLQIDICNIDCLSTFRNKMKIRLFYSSIHDLSHTHHTATSTVCLLFVTKWKYACFAAAYMTWAIPTTLYLVLLWHHHAL